MTYVSPEVKDLYNLLENEFHPLDLAAKVQPLLSKLSKLSDKLSAASPVPEAQLEQYSPALEKLTTLRVLQQVRGLESGSLFSIFASLPMLCAFACERLPWYFLVISWMLSI
jgi:hypothetical protein